jgi:hypothetical protein
MSSPKPPTRRNFFVTGEPASPFDPADHDPTARARLERAPELEDASIASASSPRVSRIPGSTVVEPAAR